MQFDKERGDWEELATVDPLWAVLSEPTRKRGRWGLSEFLATGQPEVRSALVRAEAFGLPHAFERALDIGCGVGRITRALSEHFDSCLGIDISETMVRHAARINADRPNCAFRRISASDMGELEGQLFDLVWCGLVLQHLPPAGAERAIRSLVARLRPGGVAIFQVPYTTRSIHRLQLARRAYRVLRRVGLSESVIVKRTPLTPMRMTTLPERRVRELVGAGGGEVLASDPHGQPDASTPSRLYFAARRSPLQQA